MIAIAFACLPLLIWLYLAIARGGFWRVSGHLAPKGVSFSGSRNVAVVIPARDEAAVIGETVRSLRAQCWSGGLHIFVVDDNSSDRTAAAAREAGEGTVTVVCGKPLAEGWTGKLWALSQGVEKALETQPDYLLFTDADIRHDPDNLQKLVGIAETYNADLTSFMVKLSCTTLAERTLIPAFVFFFFQLYPPAWIWSRQRKTAGAAGGCVLIRPEALHRIGGLHSIRGQVIDDCALARRVKQTGGRVWLGLTPDTHSTRVYSRFREVGSMISRTAFNQLHHSSLLLAGTVLGLALTFLLPIAMLFSASIAAKVLGAVTWALMTSVYFPLVRFYGLAAPWALLLPFAAVFYMAATVNSALRYWRGVGGTWKGRSQDRLH